MNKCQRCKRPCLEHQIYCGGACSVLAEMKLPYPHTDQEKLRVQQWIADNAGRKAD